MEVPRHNEKENILVFLFVCLFFVLFVCFFFLRPHLRHMEVPRLGIRLDLQLLAYTTAAATGDPSHVCDLYHSS